MKTKIALSLLEIQTTTKHNTALMYDIITIGSGTLDVIVKSSAFHLQRNEKDEVILCQKIGGKMDVDDFKMVSGGGATNVAVGCAKLGLKVACICEVGKDFQAQMIIDDLNSSGVDSQFVISERLEETAISVVLVAGDGGRSIITHRGAAYQLESRDIPWNQLSQTRWVHLGSLGGEKELIYDLLEFFDRSTIGVSWTPSTKDLQLFVTEKLSLDLLKIDVLILNKEEWRAVEKIHDQLKKQISLIAITNGEKGGEIIINNSETMNYQAFHVKTIESTGAGDAFAAGFISGLLLGNNLEQCVHWGRNNATNVIQFLGAKHGLLTKSEIVHYQPQKII